MPVDTLHIADTLRNIPDTVPGITGDNQVVGPTALSGDTIFLTENDAPWSAADAAVTFAGKVEYYAGVQGIPRQPLAGYNSLVMAMVIGVFLVIAFNMRHYSTYLKTFWSNIFSARRRQNAFDERATVSEARVLFSLVFLLCLCEGILLYSGYSTVKAMRVPPFEGIASLSILALVYYVWQLAAYRLTGYIFTSKHRAVSWFKGFTSSQALLAMMLAPPAIIILFLPSLSVTLVAIGILLYFVARLFFIIKGFRIFYHNSLSLVYFILYLCTLEIIPLIIIIQITGFIFLSL